jgi:serine/threonine protein phosphatase PrpC
MAISGPALRNDQYSTASRSPALGAPDTAEPMLPSPNAARRLSLAPRRALPVRVHRAARTDKGKKRIENQDCFVVDGKLGLAILCDGMGGQAAGGRASSLAARTFRETIVAGKTLVRSYLDDEHPGVVTKSDIVELLEQATGVASRVVFDNGRQHAQCAGMGTTLVAVLVLDNHAFIVNVGDSRAYLLRNGTLEQLTRDHTVYDELIRSGHLPPGVQPRAGFRDILTRSVGTRERCQADTLVIDIAAGDRILLCTDGVHQYFEPPEGTTDELRSALLDANGQTAADTLIDIANERGGCDDMTAVVLTVGALGVYEAEELGALAQRYESLSRSPVFSVLDEPERSSVLAHANVQTFRAGEAFIGPGVLDGDLGVLLRGTVSVDDRDKGVVELHEGEQIAPMSCLGAAPTPIRAIATQPTEVLVLPRQELFRMFRTDPELANKVLRQIAG